MSSRRAEASAQALKRYRAHREHGDTPWDAACRVWVVAQAIRDPFLAREAALMVDLIQLQAQLRPLSIWAGHQVRFIQ